MGAEVFDQQAFEGSWRQRFGVLWRALFDFQQAHPHAIPFLDLHHHGETLDPESRMVEMTSAMKWLEMFTRGQREQALVELEPAAMIAMAYGAFLGLVRGAKAGYFQLDEAMLTASEERVWAMLRR
jgi:hypothetical protein